MLLLSDRRCFFATLTPKVKCENVNLHQHTFAKNQKTSVAFSSRITKSKRGVLCYNRLQLRSVVLSTSLYLLCLLCYLRRLRTNGVITHENILCQRVADAGPLTLSETLIILSHAPSSSDVVLCSLKIFLDVLYDTHLEKAFFCNA